MTKLIHKLYSKCHALEWMHAQSLVYLSRLFKATPDVSHQLFQIIHSMHFCLVLMTLHDRSDLVINLNHQN